MKKFIIGILAGFAILFAGCSEKESIGEIENIKAKQEKDSNPIDSGTENAEDNVHIDSIAELLEYTETNQEQFYVGNKEDGTIAVEGYLGEASVVVIPDSINGKKVSAIGTNAFDGIGNLAAIVIPETVLEIDRQAFIECKKLEYVVVQGNIEVIGEQAFWGDSA